jgi:hypothetical protein
MFPCRIVDGSSMTMPSAGESIAFAAIVAATWDRHAVVADVEDAVRGRVAFGRRGDRMAVEVEGDVVGADAQAHAAAVGQVLGQLAARAVAFAV